MISVCIPVYNFNISPLVADLLLQSLDSEIPLELIVIDDGSLDVFKSVNRICCANLQYSELPENIGRSKIRNLFADKAKYDYLLFLDCDAGPLPPDFLKNYSNEIKSNPFVVCGGRVYPDLKPPLSHRLNWLYGRKRESKSVMQRNRHPARSFMTNNFIIQKKLMQQYKFDERITGYGHEDTLFGITLQINNIPIMHIHNPVCNGHLESNERFLKKSENALRNLINLCKYHESRQDIYNNEVRLLNVYQKIRPFACGISLLCAPVIALLKNMLLSGRAPIFFFDLWKLLRFMELKAEEKAHLN